jgi:hypothetical protein
MKYKVRSGAVVIECSYGSRERMSGVSSGVVKHLGDGSVHHATGTERPGFIKEGDVVVFEEGDGVIDLPDGDCVVVPPSAIVAVVEEAETDEDRKWLAEARGEDDEEE